MLTPNIDADPGRFNGNSPDAIFAKYLDRTRAEKSDAAQAVEFLSSITGDGRIAVCAIVPDSGISGRTFALPYERSALIDWIETRSGRANLYYSLNTPKPADQQQGQSGRLCENDVELLRGVAVDLDPRADIEAEPGGYDRERARLLATAELWDEHILIPPSLIVDSGNGVQMIWLFKTELPSSEQNRRIVKAQAKALAKFFGAGSDPVQSVDHLFRLPFTPNLPTAKKRAKGRGRSNARLISASTSRYSQSDLALVAPPILEPARETGVSIDFDFVAVMDAADQLEVPARCEEFRADPRCAKLLLKTDRSERDYGLACVCVEAGMTDPTEIGRIVFALSPEKLLEKEERGGGAKYAARTVQRAMANTKPRPDESIFEVHDDEPAPADNSWPDPADIFGDAGALGLGDFPLDCLTPQLAAWVRSHSRRKGVPTVFAGVAALTTISAAVGASLKIRPQQKDDWEEPSGLWTVLIAEPGSGKSPTISAALAPLRELDSRHGNEDRAAHAEWDRRQNKRRRKDEPDHPIEREPRIRRYVLDSVTIEKMVRIMSSNPRGIMRAPDEWASFLGEMGAYKKDAGGDRAMALRTFDGGSIDIERMGSGNTHAACGLQSILAGSQPDKIERALSNLAEDGMAQRTLFVLDDGARRASIDEEPDAGAEQAYRSTVKALVAASYIFDDPVRLTPEGYDACKRALEQISLIGRYPGTPAALVGHLAKWGRILPRIILAVHSFEECEAQGYVDTSKAVPLERVQRCIGIATFLVRHQVEFYRRYLVPDERDAEARWLAGFILTKPDLARFSHRTIYDARTELRGADERDRRRREAIMAKLVDAGWCRVDTMKNGLADSWLINPRVHQRFAERAKLESAQRAARLIEIEQSAKARRIVLGSDRMS